MSTTTPLHRNDDGTLPAYAWPGGYPLVYFVADSGVLCPDCANGKNGSEASEAPDTDKQWRLTAGDIHYEGEPIHCDHCGTPVESAYGPVEEVA